jgi:hypothetical protein
MAENAFENRERRVPSKLLPRPDGGAYHKGHRGEGEQRYQHGNQAEH